MKSKLISGKELIKRVKRFNKEKIHFEDKKKGYYLCNHAVGKHKKGWYKLTDDKKKVTCKNCLKRIDKNV